MRPSARCSSLKNFAFYYICNRAELPKLRIFAFCYICDNGGVCRKCNAAQRGRRSNLRAAPPLPCDIAPGSRAQPDVTGLLPVLDVERVAGDLVLDKTLA